MKCFAGVDTGGTGCGAFIRRFRLSASALRDKFPRQRIFIRSRYVGDAVARGPKVHLKMQRNDTGVGDCELSRALQKCLAFRVIDGGRALLHPVYIDDMVTAMLLCAEQPQAVGRIYNIAGDHPLTIRELATAIAHALDRRLPAGSIPLWLANLASDLFAITPGMRG